MDQLAAVIDAAIKQLQVGRDRGTAYVSVRCTSEVWCVLAAALRGVASVGVAARQGGGLFTAKMTADDIDRAIKALREHGPEATIEPI